MPSKPTVFVPRSARRLTRHCEQCGAEFVTHLSKVAKGYGRFCGRACAYRHHRRGPLAERFWPKVDKRGPMHPYQRALGPCWLWTGGMLVSGYGQIRGENGEYYNTHRVSWQLAYGPIPDGLEICHSCDNPPCCNPTHLFLGDRADNAADMAAKGRSIWGTRNHFARLDDERVGEIYRLWHAGGVTQEELASQYGVHRNTIYRIIYRKTWKPLAL